MDEAGQQCISVMPGTKCDLVVDTCILNPLGAVWGQKDWR
jgi:hypothetical protein